MKPFAYEAPESVAAAVALLAGGGQRARPLAGGTDLLPQLRQGRWDLDFVVDIKRIPELTRIAFDAGTGLTIGSAVTCAEFCENPDVQALYPGLVDAASIIGGAAIQGRATLGGNLCNAAPSGDSIAAMIIYGAEVIVAGPDGERVLPVAEFCTAPGATVLALGELVVALRVAAPQPLTGARYLRFIPRGEMDIAVVGAGAWVALSDSQQQITAARIALSAVAPTPLFVETAGTYLVGKAPTEAAFAEAAALAQGAASPIDDMRGTVAQRRHLVGVLVRRALRGAIERAAAPVEAGVAGRGA